MKFKQLLEYKVNPLFHSVEVHNAKELFETEILYTPYDRFAGNIKDERYLKNPDTISFSRDIRHPFFRTGSAIVLSFDKNKLQQRYKLKPYVGDWIFITKREKKADFYHYKEAEERAIRSIPNFGKYLINIMLPDELYDVYQNHKEHLTSLNHLARKSETPSILNTISNQMVQIKQSLPWVNALKKFSEKYNIPVINFEKRMMPRKELGLSEQRSVKMYEQMLEEEQVLSSWIFDLTYDPDKETVLMTLLNGRNYTIYDVDEDTYYSWINAPSKGKFWHEYIRDYYQVI